MISYFKVRGQSMEPWVKDGAFVVIDRMSYLFFKPKIGHVVLVRHPKKQNLLLIKRIVKREGDRYWVEGDSPSKSTDSRHYGWLKRGFLMGKVIHKTGSLALGILL